LVDVEVAHFLVLAGDGRDRSQRRTAEEDHLDLVGEEVEHNPCPSMPSNGEFHFTALRTLGTFRTMSAWPSRATEV
jgi:hypothetical protein